MVKEGLDLGTKETCKSTLFSVPLVVISYMLISVVLYARWLTMEGDGHLCSTGDRASDRRKGNARILLK